MLQALQTHVYHNIHTHFRYILSKTLDKKTTKWHEFTPLLFVLSFMMLDLVIL